MMIINMNKSERQKVYQMFDWHCDYCGKPIRYDEMQVDHVVAKKRGLYPHFDASQGRFVVEQGACDFEETDVLNPEDMVRIIENGITYNEYAEWREANLDNGRYINLKSWLMGLRHDMLKEENE